MSAGNQKIIDGKFNAAGEKIMWFFGDLIKKQIANKDALLYFTPTLLPQTPHMTGHSMSKNASWGSFGSQMP